MAYIPCLVMQEALLSSRPKPSLLKNIRLDLSQFISAGLCFRIIFWFFDLVQGVPSQNVFFKRAKNVRKSICR